MENNIFFKQKKDKFNPDVISGLTKKNNERKKNEFKESNVIFNGITNVVPKQVKNARDLQLQADSNRLNIKLEASKKMNERARQDYDLKPQKLKALPDEYIVDKKIENFDELKKNSEVHHNKFIQEHNQQKNKYNSLMGNLKDLGIIKK